MLECPEKCCACGNGQLEPCFQLGSYTIISCANCGTKLNETYFMSESFRDQLFEHDYYESVQSQAFRFRLDGYQNDPSVKVYDHYLDLLENKFGAVPGDVLDVGSAFGNFLKVSNDKGWTPHGVEFSEFSSSTAREHWGFEIHNGDITGSPYQDGQFDLVTYWDVIEHVSDPRENLLKARELLKDEGRLLITTDNYHSLLSQLASLFYRISFGLFKYPVKKFYIPHNTYYFTPSNFELLLENTGFKIVHFEKLDYPLEKLDVSRAEKVVVKMLYKVGDLLAMNTGFLVIAEKKW